MLDVRIENLGAARRALLNLSSNKTKRRVLSAVGAYLKSETQERFNTQKAPDGSHWAPLARSTIESSIRSRDLRRDGRLRARAARRISMRKILTDTARLQNSLNIRLHGSSAVSVGTNLKYAPIHQFGGQAGRGRSSTIPARPYLGLGPNDMPEIRRLVLSTILRFWA